MRNNNNELAENQELEMAIREIEQMNEPITDEEREECEELLASLNRMFRCMNMYYLLEIAFTPTDCLYNAMKELDGLFDEPEAVTDEDLYNKLVSSFPEKFEGMGMSYADMPYPVSGHFDPENLNWFMVGSFQAEQNEVSDVFPQVHAFLKYLEENFDDRVVFSDDILIKHFAKFCGSNIYDDEL